MEENEQNIIDRICRGDTAAFQRLVERYKKKIYFLAYDILGDHHEAEDISQEVFIKVFRSLRNFRRDAKMSSWIYQITANTCIDALRKKKSKPQVNLEYFNHVSLQDNLAGGGTRVQNPELSAEASIMQHKIQNALHKVTPKERTVFVMRHYNDLKIKEIAETLQVSSGTVKSLLFRALKKLRKELSTHRGKSSMEANYD
ncbi:MAG: RNA polymerase sigma factor [Candidatus Aminicenantes bacterium]|nr:RNA polymerase sigma factor [Candidatus Aminicenantes bacterium]